MFRCSYTIIRERINLCLLKLQLLKQSIKIQRWVVNTVVVWLHISGHYWCMYVALFGSRLKKKKSVMLLRRISLMLNFTYVCWIWIRHFSYRCKGFLKLTLGVWLIKTNKMHFSFLIILIIFPLHVSNKVTIRHQETVTVCAAYGM
jgi:hypothetical protein